MEDTLRAKGAYKKVATFYSLNPCFNGRYSQSVAQEDGSYAEGES